MKRWIVVTAVFLTATAMVVGTTQAGPVIYTIGGTGSYDGNTTLGKIDLVTGTYSVVKSAISDTLKFANLAPGADGSFYTWSSDRRLHRLTTDGTATAISGTRQTSYSMYGLAYRASNDTLYGYDYSADTFGTVNPTTGVWSSGPNYPPSSSTPSGGRFVALNDTWYGTWSDGTLKTFNWGTFAPSNVATNALYTNIVLATDGTTLYGLQGAVGTDGAKLYSIDTGTGALTELRSLDGAPNYFSGAGMSSSAAVPEPGSLAILSLLGCVGGVVQWRRRRAQKPQPANG